VAGEGRSLARSLAAQVQGDAAVELRISKRRGIRIVLAENGHLQVGNDRIRQVDGVDLGVRIEDHERFRGSRSLVLPEPGYLILACSEPAENPSANGLPQDESVAESQPLVGKVQGSLGQPVKVGRRFL